MKKLLILCISLVITCSVNAQIISINKETLSAYITNLQTVHDDAVEGTEFGDFLPGSKAVFQKSIDSAKVVYNNPASTDADYLQSINNLTIAYSVFISKLVTTGLVTKADLLIEINNANEIYATAEVGTQNGQFPQDAKDNFAKEIDSAQAVYDDPNADESMILEAIIELANAESVFYSKVNNFYVYTLLYHSFNYIKDSIAIPLYSNTKWTAQSDSPWLVVKPESGENNAEIYILIEENTSVNERYATITFETENGEIFEVDVHQAGAFSLSGTIPDINIELGSASDYYYFNSYLNTNGNKVDYTIVSEFPEIASSVVKDYYFGILPYSIGTTKMQVMATVAGGKTEYTEFNVTVYSTLPNPDCNLEVNANIEHNVCYGDTDGKISLNITNGTEPYTIQWNGNYYGSEISDLYAGSYNVVVFDSMFCAVSETFVVTQPDAVNVDANLVKPSKCGFSDGSIEVVVNGGNGSFQLEWSNGETVNKIENLSSDYYILTVTDINNCVQEHTYYLFDNNAPAIYTDSIIPTKCDENTGAIYLNIVSAQPYTIEWNDVSSNTEDRGALSEGGYIITVTDADLCKSSMYYYVDKEWFEQPEISLVTVDKDLQKNIVVWLREKTDVIDYYTIYRDNNDGIYVKQVTVDYTETSVYIDNSSTPKTNSYRYKISATDFCGNESMLSGEYRPIHLSLNKGDGDYINLNWESYEGSKFLYYTVNRILKTGVEEIVANVPSNITWFVDSIPISEVSGYYISIELDSIIDPLKFKSGSGPFSQSMSNITEAEIDTYNNFNKDNFVIKATNPVQDYISGYIYPEQNYDLVLYSSDGKVMSKQKITGNFSIDCSTYNSGAYILEVTNKNFKDRVVIIKK